MIDEAIQPLSDDERTYWRQEIDRAEQKRKEVAEQHDWQGNLDRYVPQDLAKRAAEVNVGADFRDVERKKAALFYDTPAVGLLVDDPDQPLTPPAPPPMDPRTGQPAGPPQAPPTLGSLVSVHQELLNAMLGASEINPKPTVHKCLLDVLAASGVGAVRVGYQATLETVTSPAVLDPVTGQELQPAQPVSIPVHETWFASRVSPQALLLPADFKDTDARHLPWIGYRWRKAASQVRREYAIPDEVELPLQDSTKPYFYADSMNRRGGEVADPHVSGVYLEYRAHLRSKARHPEVIWCLVLVDGMDQPLKHGPSPHQTMGPDGRLTPDSQITFSIHPLWIRDLPDSAYPPADVAVTGPLTKELNKFRTQMVQARDAARDVILYDVDAISPEVKDKIERGGVGRLVPIEPGKLAGGIDAIMKQVASASPGREHYTANDYIERDREAVLGISANQAGSTTQTERSATEVQTIQRNSEARFELERQRVVAWYVAVVRAVDGLVLRYGDERLAARLLGPRKGPFWAQFKAQMAGGYRYELQSDSGKYLDIEANRRQWLQMYQMTAQDPFTNRQVVLKKLAAAWGVDPSEWVVQPEPAKPAPVQAAVSLKGTDFDPTLPQFPIIVFLARQGGWTIPDEVVAQAEQRGLTLSAMTAVGGPSASPAPSTRHGGAAPEVAPISKRQAEEGGGEAA